MRKTCAYCGGDAIVGTVCPRSIVCRYCSAEPGASCRRPSGHRAPELHKVRVDDAERLDREAGLG